MTLITAATQKKIQRWKKLKEKLIEIKEEESLLRDEIAEALAGERQEGTHKFDLGAETAKVIIGYERRVNSTELKKIAAFVPKTVIKKVFKQRYNLNKKAYDELPDKYKNIMGRCITVSPKKPVLSIVLNNA